MDSKLQPVSPQTLRFSVNSSNQQKFSFPSSIIYYILGNCPSVEMFQKLHKLCKDFCSKKKVIVFDSRIFLVDDCIKEEISERHRRYQINIYKFNGNFKLWCTGFLRLRPNTIFKSCIYRCNLRALEIYYLDMTFKEMCFLLNGGNVTSLYIKDSNIRNDEDGTPVTMDIILQKCPKLLVLNYANLCEIFSTKTFENLIELEREEKIDLFTLVLSKVQDKIDPNIVCEFLKKHVHPEALVAEISFQCNVPLADFNLFQSTVLTTLRDGFKHPPKIFLKAP